jgi:hypothetical protein
MPIVNSSTLPSSITAAEAPRVSLSSHRSAVAADLFLCVDQEADVHPQDSRGGQLVDRSQQDDDVCVVVGDAAAVQLAVP